MKYSIFFKIMVVITIIGSTVSLLVPLFISYSSDYPLESRMLILVALMAGAFTVEIGMTVLREKFAKYFNIGNCTQAIRKLFHISYDEYCTKGATYFIQQILQYVNHTYMYVTGDAISIYSSVITIVAILAIIAFHDYRIAIVMGLSIPFNYFGYKLLNKKLFEKSKLLQEAMSTGKQKINSVVGQSDYIKQAASYDEILEKIQPSIRNMYGTMSDVNVLARSASATLRNMNEMIKMSIMVYVVYQSAVNQNDFLFLILYTILLPLFYTKLSTLTSLNLNKRDFDISNAFIQELEASAEKSGTKQLDNIREIAFSIDEMKIEDKVIGRNIHDKFKKGDIVFVKGQSGKGKSTLMKYLVKFREVDSILVNGVNLKEYDNASLREKIEYLSQDVPVFKGTLRENIFFDIKPTPELEAFVQNSPIIRSILSNKTLDSEISENASNLSGGEKQKLAIVRALCKQSQVLILDEFTSNIDQETAEEILALITSMKEDKIIFMITHNELPIRYSNRVLEWN